MLAAVRKEKTPAGEFYPGFSMVNRRREILCLLERYLAASPGISV
jgi:hypothetical protein